MARNERLDFFMDLATAVRITGNDIRRMKGAETLVEKFIRAVENMELDFRDPDKRELLEVYLAAKKAGFGTETDNG